MAEGRDEFCHPSHALSMHFIITSVPEWTILHAVGFPDFQ